jgi:nitroreductase
VKLLNIFECIATTGAVKKFTEKPVDEKMIGLILHMANHAPSAGNLQEWEFIVVKDLEQKKKLAEAALKQKFIQYAPVVIVVCANLERASFKYSVRGERLYAIQDTAFASLLILLSANALGLGACLVQAFDEEEVKIILGLPDELRPVAIIPIGHPMGGPEKLERTTFENLTHLDMYGKKAEMKFKPIINYLESVLKQFRKEEKKKLELEEKF